MKIAEGLARVKDLKGLISGTLEDLRGEMTVQVLDEAEDVPQNDVKIESLTALSGELSALKDRIARTNARHGLSAKIHEMESCKYLVKALDPLSKQKQSTTTLYRAGFGEPADKVKVVATYKVDEVSDQVLGLRKKIRDLDMELQKLNWQLDLED